MEINWEAILSGAIAVLSVLYIRQWVQLDKLKKETDEFLRAVYKGTLSIEGLDPANTGRIAQRFANLRDELIKLGVKYDRD